MSIVISVDIIYLLYFVFMIPSSYRINDYRNLPWIDDQQLANMVQDGHKLVFYDQLVVDIKDFNHPGSNFILEPFMNTPTQNIKHLFIKYNHSRYSEVIMCHRTIGKLIQTKKSNLQNKHQQFQGKNLFDQVNQYPEFKLHQKALNKIDFTKPIVEQIDGLSIEEKQVLLDIPIYLQNPQKVKFKANTVQQFNYTNNFWISSLCFQFFILLGFVYLLRKQVDGILLSSVPYFLFGLLKWTFIQYYFHRFKLHYDLNSNPVIGDHMMHHVLPNMKNKLALSISVVTSYMIGFALFYSLFFNSDQVIVLLLGTLTGLTLYDITHYYFHHGPEINIPLLVSLKRNHLKHHYRDSQRGFGVSNTIWDMVFGTQHLKST